jgi:putative ABC transport system permease protein
MKIFSLLVEAIGNLMLHKTRSLLAALGIIFGVASVICMLSISEVARQDVVNRIQRMGVNNLILDTIEPEEVRANQRARMNSNSNEETKAFKYGITRQDLKTLAKNVEAIDTIVPIATKGVDVSSNLKTANSNILGTTPDYCDVMSHPVRDGRFITAVDEKNMAMVCVLGYKTARDIFPLVNPIDQVVKLDGKYFTVVGVMEQKGETGTAGKTSDPDKSVFIPYETAFVRFGLGAGPSVFSSDETVEVNRAVLRISDTEMLKPVSQIATNMLDRLHRSDDFSVTVPHSLLNEQKKSEKIFRWVMGSLAAISLLVGGIGIMNIMLANTTERKSEIGLRRALGAKRSDIVSLFVSESLLLCIFGGVVGVVVGFGLAQLIGSLAQWTVIYHSWSIPLGIVVSAIVGLVFGTIPAFRAAQQDPVLALRSE